MNTLRIPGLNVPFGFLLSFGAALVKHAVHSESNKCFLARDEFLHCCCERRLRAKFDSDSWCWEDGRSVATCCSARECDCTSAGPFCAWQGVWYLDFVGSSIKQRLSVSGTGVVCLGEPSLHKGLASRSGGCDWLVLKRPGDEPAAHQCRTLVPIYSGESLLGPLQNRHLSLVQRIRCEQNEPERIYIAAWVNSQSFLEHLPMSGNLSVQELLQVRRLADWVVHKFQYGFGVCVDPGCRSPEANHTLRTLVRNFVLGEACSGLTDSQFQVCESSIDHLFVRVDPHLSAEPRLECFQDAKQAEHCCRVEDAGAQPTLKSYTCWRNPSFNRRSCCVPLVQSSNRSSLQTQFGYGGVWGSGRATFFKKRGRVVLHLMVSGRLWFSACDSPGECIVARGVRDRMSAAEFRPSYNGNVPPNMALINHDVSEKTATESCYREVLHTTGRSTCFGIVQPFALNAVDERYARPHHPVVLAATMPLIPGLLTKGLLLELNGLRVPYRFDCESEGSPLWGYGYRYYYGVPSRWHACHLHDAHIRSGLGTVIPQLPVVDDEYAELVAVYHSVLRAESSFVLAEIGARWGPWGARALAALNRVHPGMPRSVLFVEPDQEHCAGIREVMQLNDMVADYELLCRNAKAADVSRWIQAHDHVDVLDLDAQGAELRLLPTMKRLLDERVYRLICATHNVSIHETIRNVFSDWTKVDEVPYQNDLECVERYVRGYEDPLHPDRFDWRAALERGCFHSTPFGPIAHWDGMLILDNPRFFDGSASNLAMDTTGFRFDVVTARFI